MARGRMVGGHSGGRSAWAGLVGAMALCALAVPQTGASDYLGGGQSSDANEILNPEVLIVYDNFDPPRELIRVPIVKATTLVPEGERGGAPTAELQFKFTRANESTFEASLGKISLSVVNRTSAGASVVGIPISPGRNTVVATVVGTKPNGQRARDTDRITLICCVDGEQVPPIANAGENRVVASNSTVTLSGSGTDENFDPLTFEWEQTGGTPVTLGGANSANATFQAPFVAEGDPDLRLTFDLSVNDGIWTSFPDSVQITVRGVPNQPPDARAVVSPAQGRPGTFVSLDGSGTTDPEGDPFTCRWSSAPVVPITNSDSCMASFLSPEVPAETPIQITLIATDAGGAEGTDTEGYLALPTNNPPVVIVPERLEYFEGQNATLDGSGTFDPDGDPIVCVWTQLSGTTVDLVPNATVPCSAGFRTPQVDPEGETLVFELSASDGFNPPSTGTTSVLVKDGPPITTSVTGLSGASSSTLKRTAR